MNHEQQTKELQNIEDAIDVMCKVDDAPTVQIRALLFIGYALRDIGATLKGIEQSLDAIYANGIG